MGEQPAADRNTVLPNRLAREKSPYLQQHAENPVDWHPWGREAIELAQREDRPILVSIGYSACHWCHVMERESFEDRETAQLMNSHFVNIKVDREERPDVDTIYMEAVQALTGHGGWPLNVFLTPDGRPFYGGTYFPPEPRHGLPSWQQVLRGVAGAYRDQRDDVLQNAETLTGYIRRSQTLPSSTASLDEELLRAAYAGARQGFDWTHGGFGSAPKFPQPLALDVVLRAWYRFHEPEDLRFVEVTLRRMAEGGVYDQLGGGFHRYSVDAAWVVPHFEKMLYDNALLARVYTHAYQATHDALYRAVTEETLDYLMREMRSPLGGFFSAEDADSEGTEGKFYIWTPEEVAGVLGSDARLAELRFGVRPGGNFEGATILTVAASIPEIAEQSGYPERDVAERLAAARTRLLAARSKRVPPAKDTKIITSWNALAIRALAEAGAVFGRHDYLEAATRAADFVLGSIRVNGALGRSFQDGPGAVPGFLEDYAFLIEALITLYETAFESGYLRHAQDLAGEMVRRFWDDSQNAFFDTAAGQDLVVRPRSLFDNPIPSGNASATFALLRLEALTGEEEYARRAVPALGSVRDLLGRMPLGFAYFVSALDFYLSGAQQIAVVGNRAEPETGLMVQAIYDRYLPNKILAVGDGEGVELLSGRSRVDGRATAYVCERFSCQTPVTTVSKLVQQLERARA